MDLWSTIFNLKFRNGYIYTRIVMMQLKGKSIEGIVWNEYLT
jgi:hypothetical protein